MNLFGQYLKQRKRGIAAAILFMVIFVVAFALYHLPVEAVLYPAGVCLLLGILFLIMDIGRVKNKHKQLQNITTLADSTEAVYPEAEGVEEADYQYILQLLQEEQANERTRMTLRYSDMMDYYTIWAHQIKTPIASMRLNLQNEDSSLSRKLSADLFRIEQYVEMVLMFLRLDSDSTDYVIREYDLDVIVRRAVKKFAGEFISRKIKLVYEPLEVKVITDEKWLSFVVEQVLSNALKYTREGSITITLEEAHLCIRDTGMGIASEDLPRIFEKGYTGCNGRSDRRASGIGLYLCKRICNNLRHSITAESKLSLGTTIRIGLEREKLEME